MSVGPPLGVDPVGTMRLRISNKQKKNDDFKEGNEGINDFISASREMNYQLNYGREMIIKLHPTAYVLIYSTYLCTEIIKVVVYC